MLLFEDHGSRSTTVDLKSAVYAVAFAPDGSSVATGAKDGSLLIRDSSGHVSALRERNLNSPPTLTFGYLPNGAGIVIGGEFGWSCWRQEDGVWKPFGPQSAKPVTALAVLNERLVAFGFGKRQQDANYPTSELKGSGSRTFENWDISANRQLKPTFDEPNGVRQIATCPARKLVAWVTGHRKVCVYDITTPKPISFPLEHDCPAVALSTDGRSMAVAVDYTARIYDLDRKRERFVLKGHKGKVVAVAFSPDGSTLMTGSWDQTVRLWDVATGRERANYQWDVGRVCCVAYASDGLRLAAGGDLGRVVVWDAE